ncbi:hypothetical protein TRAPUB_13848 [Trametes pubescens]|uniref:Uncharacterized protein n=1 Tax=Trametes pubescens TaxID=154538 RepID=A0A1M2VQ34_TRAPU|nr:hypothetical protein TRAPUB_13848 [Trametes pubescens]
MPDPPRSRPRPRYLASTRATTVPRVARLHHSLASPAAFSSSGAVSGADASSLRGVD